MAAADQDTRLSDNTIGERHGERVEQQVGGLVSGKVSDMTMS
jgi:hypothetical protein